MNKKLLLLGLFTALAGYLYLSTDFRVIIFGHFKDFSFNILLIQFSAIAVVALLEFILIGWKASSARKWLNPSASVKRDIIIFAMDMASIKGLFGKILTFGIPFLLIPPAYAFLSRHTPFLISSKIQSPVALFLIYLLFSDFILYWLHRSFHSIQAAWELHKYHHSAKEFSILTATRDHPLVEPLWIFFVSLPSIIIGAGLEVVYPIVWLGLVHTYIIHSEIRSDWGFIGKWIIVSPQGHRIHHSLEQRHWNKNYSFMFVAWDRLFGTYHAPDGDVQNIGVEGDGYNVQNVFKETYIVICRSLSALPHSLRLKQIADSLWKRRNVQNTD